jgi:hypothetical protein
VVLWLTIATSAFLFVNKLWVRILLLVIALLVTLHLIFIKTYHPEVEDNLVDDLEQDNIFNGQIN